MNSAIERLLSLRVVDIMTRYVVTVSRDQKLSDAARLLIESNVTGAPVVDAEGRCVGILSATDFLRHHSQADGKLASDSLVHEHMSPNVQTISESETLTHAARRLCAGHIHRLPVVAANEQVVGWVSSLDLVAAMIHAIEE
jgi:CBS domain-containing protein